MSKAAKLKVGLALGSGAARGWAHLGVIDSLRKLGIEAEVITGCSIGSFVGAAYATDKFDLLNDWAHSLSSWQVFSLMDFSLNKGGLLTGERIFRAATEYIGDGDIEQLNKKFACVATCLESGREIWMQQGKLSAAVRASCAMPGLMSPHHHDQRWLVDGALVNPVPVSLCRAMGADLVIAVNLNSDTKRSKLPDLNALAQQAEQAKLNASNGNNVERIDNGFWRLLGGGKDFFNSMVSQTKQALSPRSPSMIGVMSNSMDIMQERLTRSRMAGDPPDVLIAPKMGDFSIMDFHRAEEAYQEGARATQLVRHQLEALIQQAH